MANLEFSRAERQPDPSRFDGGDGLVKVVRRDDGSAFLVLIHAPNAWVYRLRVLRACDVD